MRLRAPASCGYIGQVPRWPLPFEEEALLTLRSRKEHGWRSCEHSLAVCLRFDTMQRRT